MMVHADRTGTARPPVMSCRRDRRPTALWERSHTLALGLSDVNRRPSPVRPGHCPGRYSSSGAIVLRLGAYNRERGDGAGRRNCGAVAPGNDSPCSWRANVPLFRDTRLGGSRGCGYRDVLCAVSPGARPLSQRRGFRKHTPSSSVTWRRKPKGTAACRRSGTSRTALRVRSGETRVAR
jgi:hypothetical protein